MDSDKLSYFNETMRKALFDLAEAKEDLENEVTNEFEGECLNEDEDVTEAAAGVASAAHMVDRVFDKFVASTDDESLRKHYESTRGVVPHMSPDGLRKIARWFR